MNRQEIIYTAILNLERGTDIKGHITLYDTNKDINLDGILTLEYGRDTIQCPIWVKRELRNMDLPKLFELHKIHPQVMVVAARILPAIKKELRQMHVAYLEANGNLFVQQAQAHIWIDANKPWTGAGREKTNRAFSKTGLKVLFYLLLDEQRVNQTYREIAIQTGAALGNVNYVMTGLKEMGYLLDANAREYKLTNKKQLLEKWIVAYNEKLKPTLLLGNYTMHRYDNWQQIPLTPGKTLWGGEAAGDLYTRHLRPGEITLYTSETTPELIKKYGLIPNTTGNVKVYNKFWNYDIGNMPVVTVPPLLAYADLINSNDKRSLETAQMIYEQYLRQDF